MFFGFDQSRDELLCSAVEGSNPFKDVRVRTAVYQAIDIGAIRARIKRNAALPTGASRGRSAPGPAARAR